jgi:hypothetical protein
MEHNSSGGHRNKDDVKKLIGLKFTEKSFEGIFVSLSCTSCYSIMEEYSTLKGKDGIIDVFLVDKDTDEEAERAKRMFPDISIPVKGGGMLFGKLAGQAPPLYTKTDARGVITKAEIIASFDQLEKIVKKERYE